MQAAARERRSPRSRSPTSARAADPRRPLGRPPDSEGLGVVVFAEDPSVWLAPKLASLVLLAQEAALLLDQTAVGAGNARVLGEGVEDLERGFGVIGRAVGPDQVNAKARGHVAEGAALLFLVELSGEGERIDPVDLPAHRRGRLSRADPC